jgi:hypothetical protein
VETRNISSILTTKVTIIIIYVYNIYVYIYQYIYIGAWAFRESRREGARNWVRTIGHNGVIWCRTVGNECEGVKPTPPGVGQRLEARGSIRRSKGVQPPPRQIGP